MSAPANRILVRVGGDGFAVTVEPAPEGLSLDATYPTHKQAFGYAVGLRMTHGWPVADLSPGLAGDMPRIAVNSDPVASNPVDLGRGYSVEFAFDGARLNVVWSPDLPPPHIGRKLLPTYERARDAFLAVVADRLGIDIAVFDLPATGSVA